MPRGFRAAGVACGIKSSGARDLTLIESLAPATAAGVYTENLIYAAPVGWDRRHTPTAGFRALVVNSGNANACTGELGERNTQRMAQLAAESVGATAEQALVMSTGVIGEQLPMDRIDEGIAAAAAALGETPAHFQHAAEGILTTDLSTKVASTRLTLDGADLTLSAMAKGAGMIGPQMATMLAVVLTDASLEPTDARQLLRAAVDDSFNCISVEGHMSTNDTVLLLASGQAVAEPLRGAARDRFLAALREVCIDLAKMIPRDGEGATRVMQLRVRGCATRADARKIAKTVAESPLVKTALAGGDPNWGRFVSAAGYAQVRFVPQRLSLAIDGTTIFDQGQPVPFDRRDLQQRMQAKFDLDVVLTFGEGNAEICFWASDLNEAYVRFNAEYS